MKEIESLIAGKKWTELLEQLPANRTIPMIFPDGRAMESFKSTAMLSNRRGERGVVFSVRMDYKQRIVTVVTRKRNGHDS